MILFRFANVKRTSNPRSFGIRKTNWEKKRTGTNSCASVLLNKSSEILREAAGVNQGPASDESAAARLAGGYRRRVRSVPRAEADAPRASLLQVRLTA